MTIELASKQKKKPVNPPERTPAKVRKPCLEKKTLMIGGSSGVWQGNDPHAALHRCPRGTVFAAG